MAIPNIIADFSTILALKVAAGATTATLVSATDSDGVALPTGTYGFTIDRKNSNKEYITATLTGTALTDIKTIAVGTGIASTGFARAHRRNAEVIISDFVVIKRLQDVFETGYDYAISPTSDYMLATKKYVDDLALGGATTVDKVTVAGIAGETLAAGNLVYLKVADARWWKCDADDASTIDNVMLGIAQGSGTAGNAITSGVLIKGVDSNQSALSAFTVYYASNTAGGISSSSGTITRVIGISHPSVATKLYFDPDFNKVYKNYAVDAVGTDSYAITLQSAFGALYAGMEVTFKAGTANTGAATLAVNGLTATAITKFGSTALVTGDILAGQVVKVVYDGTQFQIVSLKPTVLTSDVTGLLPVANGGRASLAPFKIGVTTRDMTAASGAVTIAHGLGIAPTFVRITALVNDGNTFCHSFGTFISGTNRCIFSFLETDAAHPNSGNDTTNGVYLYLYNGRIQSAVISVDATNITLTWTKTSTPTGTAQILWEVQA